MPLETIVVDQENLYDILVIGGGPAGLTAASYCAKSGLKTGMIEKSTPGGKLVEIRELHNFPGLENINGTVLATNLFQQMINSGCKYLNGEITSLVRKLEYFACFSKNGETWFAKSVIIATGTIQTKLNIPGENEYENNGISYCVTCDGHLSKGKDVAVVGDGAEAIGACVYLSNIANQVCLITTNSEIENEQLLKEKNIKVFKNTKPISVNGDSYNLKGLTILDKTNNAVKDLRIDSVFISMGHSPSTEFIFEKGIVGNNKLVVVNNETKATSVPGIFAAGDVIKEEGRQVITAANDGAVAAMNSINFVKNIKKI